MSESRSDRLERLEDVFALQNLKAQYTDRCDDGYDPEGIAKLFVPDGIWKRPALAYTRDVTRSARSWPP